METEIKFLSAERLDSLKKGDTFTTEGFFQGLSPAPCVWTVEKVVMDKANVLYTLCATYLGVKVGRFSLRIKKGKIRMEEILG